MAADEAATEAAEAAEARQDAKQSAERRYRENAILEMQKTITEDARDDVGEGFLDGPILYTTCNPLGGGSIDDLTALTTTFDCLAVNEEMEDGRASGYSYGATMNWDDRSYTWKLGG